MDRSFLEENGVNVEAGLELLGDMDMYNETMNDFLSEINEKMPKVIEYKNSGDMPNYAILVHSIKSDSKYLGFTALAGICFEQEIKSKENNIKYIKDDYSKLIKELDKMIDISNKYLNM